MIDVCYTMKNRTYVCILRREGEAICSYPEHQRHDQDSYIIAEMWPGNKFNQSVFEN